MYLSLQGVVRVRVVHARGGDVVELLARTYLRLRDVDDIQDLRTAEAVICTARMTRGQGLPRRRLQVVALEARSDILDEHLVAIGRDQGSQEIGRERPSRRPRVTGSERWAAVRSAGSSAAARGRAR
jgi:hypothetical protein